MSSAPAFHKAIGAASVYSMITNEEEEEDPENIPISYNSVFTPLGDLHNTRAVITTSIALDLEGALNFCQLFRYAWPRIVTQRTKDLMGASYVPRDQTQFIQPSNRHREAGFRSSEDFSKVYKANVNPRAMVNPIKRMFEFILEADIANQTDLAILAATSMARFNRSCNEWPLLKDDKLPDYREALRNDPLANERDRQTTQLTRRKRVAVGTVITAGALVTAAGTGIYFWIKNMIQSAQLAEHARQIGTLNQNSEIAQRTIRSIDSQLGFGHAADQAMAAIQNIHNAAERFESNIQQFETAFSNAKSGQLTLGAVTTRDLKTIYDFALITAQRNSLYLPITSGTDLLNLPTSAKTIRHVHVIEFVIPVADKMQHIYSLTPTPIVVQDTTSNEALLIDVIAENNIIAASTTKDGITEHNPETAPLSKNFLAACIVIDKGHVCYNRLGLSHNPHTCIEARFTRSRTNTARLCTFKLRKASWAAAISPDNTVHITTARDMNTTVTCESRNDKNTTTVTFARGTKGHRLPAGCTIHNNLFSIAGLPYELGPLTIKKSVTFNINQDILQGQSVRTVQKATKAFIDHGQKPPEIIKDLLSQFDKLPSLPVDTAFNSMWNIILLLALIFTIAGTVLYCHIRHVRGSTRRHKRYSRRAYTDLASMVTGNPVQEEAFAARTRQEEEVRGARRRLGLKTMRRATGAAVRLLRSRERSNGSLPSPATRARREMLAAAPRPAPRPNLQPRPNANGTMSYRELMREQATNEYLELRQARQQQQHPQQQPADEYDMPNHGAETRRATPDN